MPRFRKAPMPRWSRIAALAGAVSAAAMFAVGGVTAAAQPAASGSASCWPR